MLFGRKTLELLPADETLPGRDHAILSPEPHAVHGRPIVPPWPEGMRELVVGMGCFWGAERIYWQHPGVWTTAVGYAGGRTPNPTYGEVCSGRTNHAEVARVVYDPNEVTFEELLVPFWEQHDPTTPMRQGNDVGTQYRSLIQVADADERAAAEASRERYQEQLTSAGHGTIVTEIVDRDTFYYAEAEHQQYLHHHPGGYCNHGLCQVRFA